MAHSIAPSLLASNFLYLGDQIEMVNRSEADMLHIDVMDGLFVPNISFGQVLMPFISKSCRKELDVHLMIEDPDRYVEEFVKLGASRLSVHYEASRHVHRSIQHIKSQGDNIKAGIALNPHTPVHLLDDILEELDIVLLMSVNPGFGGQKFIYRTLAKIRQLKSRIIERNLNVQIEIDGGVGLHNAEEILKAGADILVAGNSVFASPDPIDTIHRFKSLGS